MAILADACLYARTHFAERPHNRRFMVCFSMLFHINKSFFVWSFRYCLMGCSWCRAMIFFGIRYTDTTHASSQGQARRTKFNWRGIAAVVSPKAVVLIAFRAVDCSPTYYFANMMHVHATDPPDIPPCPRLPPQKMGLWNGGMKWGYEIVG